MFFEVHELGISLDHHLTTSFVVSLHSFGHSGGRKLERKKQIFFYRFFSIFSNLLSNHLIWCYACMLIGMYNNYTKFHCSRMGIGWDRDDVMFEANKGQDASWPVVVFPIKTSKQTGENRPVEKGKGTMNTDNGMQISRLWLAIDHDISLSLESSSFYTVWVQKCRPFPLTFLFLLFEKPFNCFLIFNLTKAPVSGRIQVSEWLEMRENCGKRENWLNIDMTDRQEYSLQYFALASFCRKKGSLSSWLTAFLPDEAC